MIPFLGDCDPDDLRTGRFGGREGNESFGVVAVVPDVGENLVELLLPTIGVI